MKIQNPWVPFAFITGGFFSGLAGFWNEQLLTHQLEPQMQPGNSLNNGLKVAFRSGAVMGLVVVGLALLDISLWYIILDRFIVEATSAQKTCGYNYNHAYVWYGCINSSTVCSCWRRVYTKAADVGADLVGKIEAGIPEDDP